MTFTVLCCARAGFTGLVVSAPDLPDWLIHCVLLGMVNGAPVVGKSHEIENLSV